MVNVFGFNSACDVVLHGCLGDRYREFLGVVKEGQGEVEQVTRLRGLVFHLPMVHYHTLRYLTLHLNKVADYAEQNKVSSYGQSSHPPVQSHEPAELTPTSSVS